MSRVVSKTRTLSKTAAPKVKVAKPLKSVRADPLSEDDFELEGKQEADQYALRQRNEQEREEQRQENKRRRAQGLAPKALPKRIREERKLHRGSDDSEEEEEQDPRAVRGRYRKTRDWYRTTMPEGREDELRYEGQIILPFNPLPLLSGLPDPDEHERNVELAKQELLRSYFADRDAPGDPGPSTTASASSMTMRNGCLVKKELADRVEHVERTLTTEAAPIVKTEPPSDVAEEEEEEEVPEGDYDDEVVIAPWSKPLPPVIKTESAIMEAFQHKSELEMDAGIEDEEGVYSDDEFLAGPIESSQSAEHSMPTQLASLTALGPDVPDVKPQLPFTDVQAQIGVGLLDGPSGPAIPAPINRFLKGYQRAGIEFLYKLYKEGKGGILGDDMGLGKTIQVIGFLSAIMRKTGTKVDYRRRKDLIRQGAEGRIAPKHWPTALIICPSSLVRNWERELNTWGYFETALWTRATSADLIPTFKNGFLDILLTSYDQAAGTIEILKEMPFSVVIVDEAHRLKEPRATRTLALKKIQCKSCFALTGTLIQNRIDEMWSVLDFVQRGWAGTFRQWREFAVNPIRKGHRLDGSAHDVVLGIKRLGEVYKRLLPNFYLRRDKRLIAHELPEKRDMVVFCPLAERQVLAYQRLIESDDVQFIVRRNDPCDCGLEKTRLDCCHSRTEAGESVRDVVFKYMTALSKVANHLGLLYHARDDPPQVRQVNSKIFEICTGSPYDNKRDNAVDAALDPTNCGKWKLLAELLKQWRAETTKKNKVLIFSNSVRLLRMIEHLISTSLAGFEYAVFTGEATGKERMQMVDDFQDPKQDHFILLISTQAGGVGLNLTAANKVVIFDPDWNPANDLQAMDRAFRIGQQRTVEVYRMIGLGTLEELKYERQIHKQQRSRQLNDGAFERRIHQGLEGGKTAVEQGELFGTQNIFRFNPNGFVAGNLERVQAAEDRFTQDLIEAEYDDGEDDADGFDDDEAEAKRVRKERQELEKKRARRDRMEEREKKENMRKVDDVLGNDGEEVAPKDKDLMSRMGILSQVHDTAFADSPAERQIYEIGVKLLRDNPELARTMKANDLGKLGGVKRAKRSSGAGASQGASGSQRDSRPNVETTDEPWAARIMDRPKARGNLIELSDDE